jgi:CBS domain-containing protein
MRIEQLMSRPVHCCSEGDTLNTAAQMMWEHDCGAIPVIGPDGTLVGMITDRDICMAAYTRGQCLSMIPVGEAMAKQVFACSPKDSIQSAERLMSDKQVRRVPVVDEERRPVGILSTNDITRHAMTAGSQKNGVEHQVVETLAAICTPRQMTLQRRDSSAVATRSGVA